MSTDTLPPLVGIETIHRARHGSFHPRHRRPSEVARRLRVGAVAASVFVIVAILALAADAPTVHPAMPERQPASYQMAMLP